MEEKRQHHLSSVVHSNHFPLYSFLSIGLQQETRISTIAYTYSFMRQVNSRKLELKLQLVAHFVKSLFRMIAVAFCLPTVN